MALATEETREIQANIEKVLSDNPGLTRTQLSPIIADAMGVTLNQVNWNIAKMVKAKDLIVDRSICRKHRYFIAGGQMVQRVVHIEAGAKREFFGPVLSPMQWCVNALVG